MKKIIALLSVFGLILFSSCEGPEGPPGYDGYDGEKGDPGYVSKVYEVLNKNFVYNSDDGYNISGLFNPLINGADTVLIYRLVGTIDSSTPIWQLIPKTIYLTNNRELDYSYDFSREDFKIYADGNYDIATTSDYIRNQTFRIVIVPGSFTNKSVNKPDYSDYNAVIKNYNIDDSNVKKLN